jgi:hypothetical protein
MTPVLTDPIRWFHPVRGWSHDRLALAPPGSRSGQGGSGHPRPAASGYLLAALALLLVAPSALAGWVAGAVVVGSGRVSRGRLAAAASVTGTLALLAVGPTVAAGDLLGAITTLSGVLPATLTAGAVLEALSAILVRGLGWPRSRSRSGSPSRPSRPARAWPCGQSGRPRSGAAGSGPRPRTAAGPRGERT